MSTDSAILPSGFLRPLLPALEPAQRGPTRRGLAGPVRPQLIPAGSGSLRGEQQPQTRSGKD